MPISVGQNLLKDAATGEVVMEQVYAWLAVKGYPTQWLDWLRRHRLVTIVILAALAWLPFILLGWLVVTLVGWS